MSLLAVVSLLAWMYLLLARGGFWRIEPDLLPNEEPIESRPGGGPSVLAIVPARNEADVLGETLPSLLSQAHRGAFHVLLVDDSSEDGTADAVRRAAEACNRAHLLTVLRGEPLPPGWTGKLWAMQQGFEWANRQAARPDLILFTDADIRYAPRVLDRLVSHQEKHGTVLSSLMVRLRCESFAERLLVPAFVFFFRMLYPFAWVRDDARRCAAAAGGSMLVRSEALHAAGGLRTIRSALIDDCALGAIMKSRGRVWLGMTQDVHSVRAYPRVADIHRMVARSAYAELRYSPLRLAAALVGLALVFFVPPLWAAFGDGLARWSALIAWVAMSLAFAPMLQFYHIPRWTAFGLPAIAGFYAVFTFDSALRHWAGRGGAWKGRLQAQRERPART